ncbi:MAG: GNAT family N-acetyltransferase [Bryobacteraceae bacterium]
MSPESEPAREPPRRPNLTLAVDRAHQGLGLGTSLLQDALLRSEQAARTVGIRAVLVQAIDTSARSFYLRFGFSSSPVDEMRLMLLMKDLRAFLRSRGDVTGLA